MRIQDVMSRELVLVEPGTTVGEAVALMSHRRVGSLLVTRGEELLGIFTERDVVRAVSQTPDAAKDEIDGWMTRSPATVEAGSSVGQALDLMLSGGFRHLPVLEEGRLVGVVSMRDLSRSLAKRPANV